MVQKNVNADVVVLPSFSQVEDWRKSHAICAEAGLFSQVVTTFNAWIADLWELHGDGRAIADSLQRQTIMQAAFGVGIDAEAGVDIGARALMPDGDALTASPGIVKLASECVRAAAGVPAFERAVEQAAAGAVPQGISSREAVLLQGIARYYRLLAQAGLVEVGHACAALSAEADQVFPCLLRVLVAQAAPLDWRMSAFFDSCPAIELTVEEAPGASGVVPVPEGVELSFGFPSGRYAQPGLVADLIGDSLAASATAGSSAIDAIVACKDPLSLFKQLEHPLAAMGAVGCVQAQVPFSSTDFGRQFLSLCRVIDEEDWSKADLSDAARPPFSGLNGADALQADRELRANRLATKEGSLLGLSVASDTFSQLEDLASDPDADILLGVFEQIAFTSPGRSDAWRSEQLSAMAALRSCTKAARSVGASMRSCMRVLEDVMVTVSFESAQAAGGSSGSDARVLVTTQSVASQMGAGSCRMLVLCDLTSADFPVADKDDASATLFEKLGLMPYDSMLARARRRFAALQQLPIERLVCMRPLNDWDGNPTYPAAMLQELVDAYRQDPSAQDDLDELFGIPQQFLDTMAQRGEESLFANAAAVRRDAEQPVMAEVPSGSIGDVDPSSVARVALARKLPDGQGFAGFSPSPSQVELYLECPYKWFAQRRVNIEELDEGFGALERGTFSHAVLQRFYQEFIAEGHAKVDADNLAHAKELMRRIADDEERAQRALEPGSGRYVAVNRFEQRELDECKNQLVDYLDFESRFLPTFHPAYLEYEIGPQDGVEYAGRPFMGIVDRIDVDDAGNAVIVDYKGSVGPAHEIAGKGPRVPGKVQTRMYARAVERALGVRVVGALYVSYGASHGCAGAFDGRALEAAHVPYARVDHCSCAVASPPAGDDVDDFSQLTFGDMLDSTEALVATAIESMQAGEVQPAPATPDACRYCPVANCPKRGA